MPAGRDYPVRELRERLGLTQSEFAREVGVEAATVSRWERGVMKPTALAIKMMEALAKRAERRGKAVAAQVRATPNAAVPTRVWSASGARQGKGSGACEQVSLPQRASGRLAGSGRDAGAGRRGRGRGGARGV